MVLTLNDRILKKEETLRKIQKRIDRRKQILYSLDAKYMKKGVDTPNHIIVQRENTLQKIKELEAAYIKTQHELQKLRMIPTERTVAMSFS